MRPSGVGLVQGRGRRREVLERSHHRRDTPRNRLHQATGRTIRAEARGLAREASSRVHGPNPHRERTNRRNVGALDGSRSAAGGRFDVSGDRDRAWTDSRYAQRRRRQANGSPLPQSIRGPSLTNSRPAPTGVIRRRLSNRRGRSATLLPRRPGTYRRRTGPSGSCSGTASPASPSGRPSPGSE